MKKQVFICLAGIVIVVIAVLGSADKSFALSNTWQEPTPVPIEWTSGHQGSTKPCVTSDGQMLSFMRFTPHQVHTAEWNDVTKEWDRITHVTGLGQSWTSASCISPDKQWLFYVGSSGLAGDIYRSTWMGDHWGPGESAPLAAVNTSGYEDTPYFDGNRLYFAGGEPVLIGISTIQSTTPRQIPLVRVSRWSQSTLNGQRPHQRLPTMARHCCGLRFAQTDTVAWTSG